jgi:ADP-ribosylglycohydrolase
MVDVLLPLRRNDELLTYIAIGDAYCMATEYIKSPRDDELKAKALEFKRYLSHPSHGLKPGTYTDDTHMSIGNAEVLTEGNHTNVKPIDFASKWVEVYRRDRRTAYSRNFQLFLDRTSSGKEFLDNIVSTSNKNGAAMRSVPLGVLPTPEETMRVAELQAKLTHNSPGGIFSSKAVALMAHFAMHETHSMSYKNLSRYLMHYLHADVQVLYDLELIDECFKEGWCERVAGPEVGIITTFAVFELLTSCDSLVKVLRKTIEWGGDTDSVAAIALGIASCRRDTEFTDDLPDWTLHGLETGKKFGREFLNLTSKKLMDKFE